MIPLAKKINPVLLFTLILLLQTYLMVAKGYEKDFFHLDEAFTFMLSNSKYGIEIPDEYKNNWRSGNDYYNLLTTSVDSRFNYKQVYTNQTKDVHPPLYYFIIHTITSFFPQQFSKWFGIIPNIFFFLCTQIFIFLLSNNILNSKYKAILPCLLYGFSLGTVSTVEFIRMYGMMTAILMIALYINCRIIYNLLDINKYIIFLFFINTLGYLTHYYYIIHSFFICSFMTIYLYINTTNRNTIKYSAINILALITFILIYPDCFAHIFSGYRGTEAFQNLATTPFWERLVSFYKLINKYLFCSFLGTYILCTLGYLAIQNLKSKNGKKTFSLTACKQFLMQFLKIKNSYSILLLLIVAISSLLIIIKIAAYRELRYISALFPVIYIIFSYVFFITSTNHLFTTLLSTTLIFAIIYSGISFDYAIRYRDHQKISTIIAEKRELIVVDLSEYDLMASIFPRAHLYKNVIFITHENRKNITKIIKEHYTQHNNIGIYITYPYITNHIKEINKIIETLKKQYTLLIKQNDYMTCISIIAQKNNF